MCRKLIYLISFVVLLSAASSVQALTTVTTAVGNGADTFVGNDSKSSPTATHGTATELESRYAGTDLRFRAAYLRFDISDVGGDMTGAKLVLDASYLKSSTGRVLDVYGLKDETLDLWNEGTTNYNNAPGMIPDPPTALGYYAIDGNLVWLGTIKTPPKPNPVVYPVTFESNDVNLPLTNFLTNLDTNKLVTFVLINASGTAAVNCEDRFASKEHATFLKPTLTLPNAFPLRAYNPNPATGSTLESTTSVLLQWQPGVYADKHDVYLGTDQTKVTDANRTSHPGLLIYDPNHEPNNRPATGLIPGKTYYWRIDEVNDACSPGLWRGPIWNFLILPSTAWDPTPPDGAQLVAPKITLRWHTGSGGVTGHRVYLGSTFAEVDNAPVDSNALPYRALVAPSDYPNWNPSKAGVTLNLNTTYYWRIDEVVGANRYKGSVWDFKTLPTAPAEPNLVGWWKFDGDANDSSGHWYNGAASSDLSPPILPTYIEDLQLYPGSKEISLAGNNSKQYVDLPIGTLISSLTNSTFAMWVNFRASGSTLRWQRFFDFGTGITNYMRLLPRFSDSPQTHFEIRSGDVMNRVGYGWNGDGGTGGFRGYTIPLNEWHHLAVTIDANDADANFFTYRLYLDGDQVGINTQCTLTPSSLGITTLNWLGRSIDPNVGGLYLTGYLDDFRIYDRALSDAEIATIGTPLKASQPSPRNNATGVVRKPTLTWKAGRYAASANGHKVYFDPNQQKVIDRSAECDVNGVSTTNPSYAITTLLEPVETYYWAVDEVNGAYAPYLWVGDVWRFTTRDYLVVEDFDSYANTDPALHAVWKDYTTTPPGINAYIYANTDANFARDGNSMQYDYKDYAYPYYSEAYAATTALPSGIGSNWTIGDVEALVLYFYGKADNDANEKMYVELSDADSSATVIYDGDMNDIREPVWHEWNIKLASFTGVTLTNVTRITIGFGDGSDPYPASGIGTVYFEDIRLHPTRCVLSKRSADFARADYVPTAGDCDVNYQELDEMVGDWLRGTVPTAGEIWLEAEDANTIKAPMQVYSDRADASGGEYIAVLPGTPAPYPPTNPDPINDPCCGVAIYNFTVDVNGTYKIFGRVVATSGTTDSFWVRIPGATTNTNNDPNDPNWIRWDVAEDATGAWTWDEINSDNDNDATVQFTMSPGTYALQIVHRERTLLDRLLITNNLNLSSDTLPPWPAELNGDSKIDFKDFALLAKQWLVEQLFP
jgi:hypothetical protein